MMMIKTIDNFNNWWEYLVFMLCFVFANFNGPKLTECAYFSRPLFFYIKIWWVRFQRQITSSLIVCFWPNKLKYFPRLFIKSYFHLFDVDSGFMERTPYNRINLNFSFLFNLLLHIINPNAVNTIDRNINFLHFHLLFKANTNSDIDFILVFITINIELHLENCLIINIFNSPYVVWVISLV